MTVDLDVLRMKLHLPDDVEIRNYPREVNIRTGAGLLPGEALISLLHLNLLSYIQGPAVEQNQPMEHVKKNQKSNSHNTQPVRIPHEDPLVVSLTVAKCLVRRVLIDPGSSANIMPRDTFDRLEIKQDQLKSTGNPLLGFDGKRVEPVGTVEVAVHAAERVLMETFVVVEIHPSYNLLMGRGWIHRVRGVPSTLHQVMRCLAPDGTKVIDIHGDQVAAKECYSVTMKHAGKGKALIRSIDQFRPERTTRVGERLVEEEKQELVDFFVSKCRCKQRRFAPERNRIIVEEVDKLLDAGFVGEVYYPDWLSNVVVVQKKNGKWRIPIDPVDEEKTSFVTERGTYCYKVMPFGLKNAGATYQRLISKIFTEQIGKTVEAYIDDMVVKSKKKADHV
ncbi:uncharacterized protein LOC132314788 [Cornus florida]|uniref:uncharacterized protein LOC132314788 n=1 Tax=Cornus florida TaxID=4283 RepID=UPI00289F8B22|nr:uncharacterized protein LOC132314788 [Cornus florida]